MKKIVLDNGITVLLKQKTCESITLQASFNVGSIDECEGEKGYSHLIEHLLFEGTTKRPSAKIISGEIENVGGDLNAMTSNEQTTYYAKVPAKHVELAIDVITDMVTDPLFEVEKIKKEQRVVLEEIKMITDQPRYFQWLFFEKHLLKGTPYEIPVYGYEKDVAGATKDSLTNYYKKLYVPKNCIISLVGKFNESDVLDLLEKHIGFWKNTSNYERTIYTPTNEKRFAEHKKDIQQVYIIKGYVVPGLLDKTSAVIDVIESILGKPQSGRLYDKLRNDFGYAYDISINYECFHTFGFIAINVGCEPQYSDKVSEIITQELELLSTVDVPDKELRSAKSYIEGKYLLDMEDTHKEADNLVTWEFIAGKDLSDEHMNKILAVTKEDILAISKQIFTKDITEIRILPK